MLFSGIKRIPGPSWHGFNSQHVHVMVRHSRISNPEQFLPPRDPDWVATFCRPATRATQRPCQPWSGLSAETRQSTVSLHYLQCFADHSPVIFAVTATGHKQGPDTQLPQTNSPDTRVGPDAPQRPDTQTAKDKWIQCLEFGLPKCNQTAGSSICCGLIQRPASGLPGLESLNLDCPSAIRWSRAVDVAASHPYLAPVSSFDCSSCKRICFSLSCDDYYNSYQWLSMVCD